LSLEWEESEGGGKLLPYLEGCSADIEEGKLYIFGGMDKDGKMTNDLIRYDLCRNRVLWGVKRLLGQEKMEIFKVESRDPVPRDSVPCLFFFLREVCDEFLGPRKNHGSGIKHRPLCIFGGEINQSDTVNDFWYLGISWIDEGKDLK